MKGQINEECNKINFDQIKHFAIYKAQFKCPWGPATTLRFLDAAHFYWV